ncbi:MAG: hypothetical protein LBF66_01565 [Holosporales bacterium]|jgi:hypothetical protein|nr:hypothetical protein [Holosporales bacterium]
MNKVNAFAAFFQRNFVTVFFATFFMGSLSAGIIKKKHSIAHLSRKIERVVTHKPFARTKL